MKLFLELAKAYSLSDQSAIQMKVDEIREAVEHEIMIDIGDIDPDMAEDYVGDDPYILSAKYIVTLERSIYGQDEYECQQYLKTGAIEHLNLTG